MEIMNPTPNAEGRRAFTIVELLVVILIIGILVAFAFPAFQGVLERAKKVQAKNDLTQIVTAVNAFYTEYGKYPTTQTSDYIYGATTVNVTTTGPANATNDALFNELRACIVTDPSCSAAAALNTRQIVFISPPIVKNPTQPRSGIGTTTGQGQYFDPWGTPYNVEIDGDYTNNIAANPYGNNNGAGPSPVAQGVIAWSLGKDGKLGNKGDNLFKNASGVQSDDVISWQ
jgi:prepilin-type N-terminal cleavage/methylation domain-containing protein